MTSSRESDIIRAFVTLSNDLASDYDIVDLLSELTVECARLLDIESCGLLLADARGVLHVVAASSERTHNLELFQLQRKEGPCLDCYREGHPIIVPDLPAAADRWPAFCQAAESAGFASVHALPMRLRHKVLGALGLFGAHAGTLEEGELALGQALVHVASVAIVNEKAAADAATVNAQLQHALSSRIVLEQAKGVIAYAGNLDMDQAFLVLRRYARDHGRRLSEVASEVVHRRISGDQLLAHARAASIVP